MLAMAARHARRNMKEKAMQATDIMTRHVIVAQVDASLQHAVQTMLQYGVSGLPVVDATGRVVGMLTEGDLLRRSELHTGRQRPRWLEYLVGPGKLADEYIHTHSREVRDVMTAGAVTVAPDTPLGAIVELMERHRIKRVPVVGADGALVGIISRASLVRALWTLAPDIQDTPTSDAQIQERLQKELAGMTWARQADPGVLVRNGVVNLYGTVTDHRQADALRVAAENIPGVKLVRCHMLWCDPSSAQVFELPEQRSMPAPQS
jgi:CBS domain-containing protein